MDILSNQAATLSSELQSICDGAYALQVTHSPYHAALVGHPSAAGELPDIVSGARYPWPLDPSRRENLESGFLRLQARLGALTHVSFAPHEAHISARMSEAIGVNLDVLATSNRLRPIDHRKAAMPQVFADDLAGTGLNQIRSPEDVENAVERAEGWGRWVTQAIEHMREGAKRGITQPQAILGAALVKQEALLEPGRLDGIIGESLSNVRGLSDEERQQYRGILRELASDGYVRLNDAIRDNLPLSRTDDELGLCHIPGGREEYATMLRYWTGEDRDIHDLQQEMQDGYETTKAQLECIAHRLGHTSIEALEHFSAPSLRPFRTVRAIREHYEAHKELILQNAHRVIKVPHHNLEYDIQIRETGDWLMMSSPAMYQEGNGSRPGSMVVYVGDPAAHNLSESVLNSVHEGFGHHVQLSRQQELPLPKYLQSFAPRGEFREGWAMYVEQFADQLGLSVDDYTTFARLHRQFRCYGGALIDLGIHHDGWSLEQAKRARREMMGPADPDPIVESEYILRLAAWPGTVNAYNAGSRFSQLLARAQAKVRSFNLSDFNTMLLDEGEMPISALERKVDRWIASTICFRG